MSRASILIVDDTPLNLVVLGELLQPRYQVRAANSGERALAVVAGEPRPDLILLDVMMPGMDGFEVLRRLRADDRTREIPVIFVTALQDEDDEQRGFELGAADYIHKPIKSAILLSRVGAQLDAKAARDMLKKTNQRLVTQVAEGSNALEQAQLQLMQSEKMAAMGQLAAGVAHEINNPIGFVNSNLGTLNSYLGDIFTVLDVCLAAAEASPHPADFEPILAAKAERELDYLRTDAIQLLAESREGLERVRKIVQDLRDFSRVGETQWQWADIHHGLDSTLNIVWNELKYTCEVIRHYG
jgi:CheY-like chemotaxis protein